MLVLLGVEGVREIDREMVFVVTTFVAAYDYSFHFHFYGEKASFCSWVGNLCLRFEKLRGRARHPGWVFGSKCMAAHVAKACSRTQILRDHGLSDPSRGIVFDGSQRRTP